MTSTIDPQHYKTLTFDCYGTLIDWERGLLDYLQPLLKRYYVNTIDEFVLGLFADLEPESQDQGGTYREVLARVMHGFAHRLAFTPPEDAVTGLAESVPTWPPFPDTVQALQSLQSHFKLAVLSNVDDDLFAGSAARMEVEFDHIITAQQVGKYKPDRAMFDAALAQVEGPVLHVAQSRYHDILPATELGLDTAWIHRPSLGAARPMDAKPTWTFTSLADLASAVGA